MPSCGSDRRYCRHCHRHRHRGTLVVIRRVVVIVVVVYFHNNRNTGNHDIHNNDNGKSGMLLPFSRTGGAMYYNDNTQRKTVPLYTVILAQRKLQVSCLE